MSENPGAYSLVRLALLQTWAAFCPDDRLLRRWMLLDTLCWLVSILLMGSPVAALMKGLFLIGHLAIYYRFHLRQRAFQTNCPSD